MLKRLLYTSILSILISGCISQVDINPELEDNYLVVEGFITDEPGPHFVRLSRLANFAGTFNGGTIFPVNDAQVFLTDDESTRTEMLIGITIRKEITRGVLAIPPVPPMAVYYMVEDGYRTPADFSGIVGNTYTLHIITNAGKRYVSSPQKLNSGPPIDSLILNFKILPSVDPIDVNSGVEVLSRWQDPAEEDNFYSWKLNGTYFIETTPGPQSGDCLFDPDDGCCDKCWIEEKDIEGSEVAFSDIRSNGSMITQRAGFVFDDGFRFGNTRVSPDQLYYVEIEQFSISKEAFNFNKILNSQLQIDGDIFDPPPASIGGNIRNEDDPTEPIVGFFGAHSIKRKGTFIKRTMLDRISRWEFPCGDCRVRGGATLEIPEPYR